MVLAMMFLVTVESESIALVVFGDCRYTKTGPVAKTFHQGQCRGYETLVFNKRHRTKPVM